MADFDLYVYRGGVLQPDLWVRHIEIDRLFKLSLSTVYTDSNSCDSRNRIHTTLGPFDFDCFRADQDGSDFVAIRRLAKYRRYYRHGLDQRALQCKPHARRIDANHFGTEGRFDVMW